MDKMKLYLGMLWTSPITLLCFFFYILPFKTMGWYDSLGFREKAWVYTVNAEKAPSFLMKYWAKWAGHAMGNLVVLKKYEAGNKSHETTLVHEMVHVRQCMLLGVFQPILYGLLMVAGKILQKYIGDYDAYYDNAFEVHARRVAGQVVDVVGYVKKLQATKKTQV